MTVGELAEVLEESSMSVVIMAAVSQMMDTSTCEAVVEGFGKVVVGEDDDEYDDDEELAASRAR